MLSKEKQTILKGVFWDGISSTPDETVTPL
jgi:hypothetical protein